MVAHGDPDCCRAKLQYAAAWNDVSTAVTRNKQPLPIRLEQNYPNPFVTSTTIRYTLDRPAHVKMVIYDAIGRRVRVLVDRFESAGEQSVIWEGRDDAGSVLSSGHCLARIEAGEPS